MRAFSRTSAMSSSLIRPATMRSLRGTARRTSEGIGTEVCKVPLDWQRASMNEPTSEPHTSCGPDPTLGALVNELTTQVPELIRSELRLAQAEMAEKGKRAGLGIGMFSAAGLLAFFGLGTLIATAVLALSLVMDAWLAALIVAVVLFAAAGVLGADGQEQGRGGDAAWHPSGRWTGVKEDIATVKGQRS